MLTMKKLCKELKKDKQELNKEICSHFNISQVAVFYWWNTGIPANRQIEIVKHFKLDPKILTK